MAGVREEFKEAMEDAFWRKRFKNLRDAGEKTHIDFTLLGRMKRGHVPSLKTVIKWATAIGDPVNKWLILAGFEPIPGFDDGGDAGVEEDLIRARIPSPPEAVRRAAREAPTPEKRIEILTDYIRRPEFGLGLENEEVDALSIHAKELLLRVVERLQGVRLLEEDDAA